MTTAQKIIKYLATAFAIFLIVTIISGILGGLYVFSGILGLQKENEIINNEEMSITSFENTYVKTLDIDVTYTNLTIKKANSLKVETNNQNITCKQSSQTLRIKEKSRNWFLNHDKGDLIIYIPENLEFEKVKINTGAGKIEIENINTRNLDLELGAGETRIEKLNVTNNCKIEGGAGKVSVLFGKINDLDLYMGIGELNVNAILTGQNKINAGIGNLNINLQGNKENYKIKVDKGIGSIKINGKEASDSEIYGYGENNIKIDGGIGNIRIDFSN